jgi:hypothetical protein
MVDVTRIRHSLINTVTLHSRPSPKSLLLPLQVLCAISTCQSTDPSQKGNAREFPPNSGFDNITTSTNPLLFQVNFPSTFCSKVHRSIHQHPHGIPTSSSSHFLTLSRLTTIPNHPPIKRLQTPCGTSKSKSSFSTFPLESLETD